MGLGCAVCKKRGFASPGNLLCLLLSLPTKKTNSWSSLAALGGRCGITSGGERHENFVQNTNKPPLSVDFLLSYMVALERAGVGITVLHSKVAGGWLCVQVLALPVYIVNRLQEKLVGHRGADTVALREAPSVLVEAFRALELYVCRKSLEYHCWRPLVDSVWLCFGLQCGLTMHCTQRFLQSTFVVPVSWFARGKRRSTGGEEVTRFIVPRFSLSEEDWLGLGSDAWRNVSPRSTLSRTTGCATWLTSSTSLQASRQMLPSS